MRLSFADASASLLVSCCLVLGACASTPTSPSTPFDPALAEFIARDPLSKLPFTQRALERITPYTFEFEGTRRFRTIFPALLESGEDATRLVMARALLDALLYAELSGSQEVRADVLELSADLLAALPNEPKIPLGDDPWSRVQRVFQGLQNVFEASGARYQPHAAACGEALVLIDLLTTRSMDVSYHTRLRDAVAPGRLFGLQARVARVLDTHQALEAVQSRPLDERTDLLLRVLGPAVCDADGLASALKQKGPARVEALHKACSRALCSTQETGEPHQERVALASCGLARWPQSISEDVYGADLGVVMALIALAQDQVSTMHESVEEVEPFSQSARAQLGAKIGSWSSQGLRLGIQWEGPNDLDRVGLVTSSRETPPLWDAREARYVVLDEESLWVGLLPTLGVVYERPGFLEAARGWGFPGRRVVDLRDTQWSKDERATIVDHIATRFEEGARVAEELQSPTSQERSSAREEIVVLIDRTMTWSRVRAGLRLLSDALADGGELHLRLAVWDAVRMREGALRMWTWPAGAFPHGVEAFAKMPVATHPLYAEVRVDRHEVHVYVRTKLVARIRDTKEGMDVETLRRVLDEARKGVRNGELNVEALGGELSAGRVLQVLTIAQEWGAVGVLGHGSSGAQKGGGTLR